MCVVGRMYRRPTTHTFSYICCMYICAQVPCPPTACICAYLVHAGSLHSRGHRSSHLSPLPYPIPTVHVGVSSVVPRYSPSHVATVVQKGCRRRTTPQDVRKVERRQRRALVRCVVTRHAAACGVGGAMMPPTSLDIVVYGHDGCCDACPRRAMPQSVGTMNAGAVFMTRGAAGWADTRRERATHASRGGAICCGARRR